MTLMTTTAMENLKLNGHELLKEIDPTDLDTFNRFMPSAFDASNLTLDGPADEAIPPPPNADGSRNLADIILAKIAQHEAQEARATGGPLAAGGDEEPAEVELPPKVVETYTIMAGLLARYRSGKLPKAFKILPTLPLPTLLAILPITQPDKWSPNAIFQATRLFVASKSQISQGFLSNVLLERVRDDIHETRKLNVHLYNSIKKSLFKPKDFFKGFLFPLLQGGTATLREAHIISSVLQRVSIPVIHSAVALAKLCEIAAEQMAMDTEAAGATNMFIRVLLEKKYALPYQTIDALVFHFLRFKTAAATFAEEAMDVENATSRQADPFAPTKGMIRDSLSARAAIRGRLPVIWHQCFLAFAQRYKDAITEDQREALLDLLLDKGHREIGPEIRRELLAGRGRGVVAGDELAEPSASLELGANTTASGLMAAFGATNVAAVEIEGGDDTMMGGT